MASWRSYSFVGSHEPALETCWSDIIESVDHQDTGFLELEHTADWSLFVWAKDLENLFRQAALGMNMLSGVVLDPDACITKQLSLEAGDHETLLVDFLSELVFLAEEVRVGVRDLNLMLTGNKLFVEFLACPIEKQEKEIKAVTFHNLEISLVENRYETTLVFDV